MLNQDEIEGNVQNLAGKIQAAAGDVTNDPETEVKGEIRQLRGKAQCAKGKVSETLSQTCESISQAGSQFLDQAEHYGSALAEKIETRPIASVLIAAGIGYILALATRRR